MSTPSAGTERESPIGREKGGEAVVEAAPAGDRWRALQAAQRERIAALTQTLVGLQSAAPSTAEWVLELGCGHGHFLARYAAEHPLQECVGIDFCRDRIRRAERKKLMAGQLNLHFLHAEAREFLAAIPDRLRFGRVFVLFPDPWPKRRHRKNRLVNASALERITAVTREGAELYFRSDAFDYGAEVGVLLGRHGSWVVLHDAHLPIDTATVFQKKARSYGTVAARRV